MAALILIVVGLITLRGLVNSRINNLNLLTSAKRYKLRIDLAYFNNNTRYAENDKFVVNSAADKYRLTSLGTYTGTAGDSNSCHGSNLNGFYYGGPHASYADGVEWSSWTGYQYSLKTTEMKIKPI